MTKVTPEMRDVILDEWEAGATCYDIASRTKMTPTQVLRVVQHARTKGDTRAVVHGPGFKRKSADD